MNPRFAAVLFDLDGTLVDSFADIAASANHALAALGRTPHPAATIKGWVGEGIQVLMQRALDARDPELIARAVAAWRPHYEAHCLDQTRPYEGIVPMLERLRGAGLPLGVVSNKLERLTRLALEGLALASFFDVVVGGDTTSARKPDPTPLRFAAEKLGLSRGRLLFAGDTANDLDAARAAGWTSCAVLWGQCDEAALRLHCPDHIVAHPREIVALALGPRDAGVVKRG
ncbi:MAG: phosphoglycolate phosphatase [Verrucomicrobiae bacterium]|nr:phosphoglycolate phosphatase [Verrucomicrobiae bacterium]